MYKKRQAMEQSNGSVQEPSSADPLLEVTDDLMTENEQSKLEKRKSKSTISPGDLVMKPTRRRHTGKKSLSRKKVNKSKKNAAPPPEPDEEGEYQVEAIVGHKKEKGKTLYRVRWVGYKADQDSWLASSDLNCKGLLNKYKKIIERESKDVYNVEKIIDHRRLKGTIYYRVRWENYSAKDDTWQAKDTLNCHELVKEYHDELNKTILKREEAKLKAQENAKNSNNEYEVESIVDCKTVKGKTKYLIHWKGWDSSDDTWEPAETLNCPDLVRAFNKKNKSTPKKSKIVKKKRKNTANSGTESDDENDSDYDVSQKRAKGNLGGGEYEVENVLDARINNKGKWEFFVMWKGWSPDNNTWEPEDHLNCPKLIDHFLGKDKVPRTIQAQLEKAKEKVVKTAKPKRKPPSARKVPSTVGGLRGRTKAELKILS